MGKIKVKLLIYEIIYEFRFSYCIFHISGKTDMPTDTVEIAGWQKSSFIDFPGIVSTVLFLSGCNLRCPYCHNPGIVDGAFEPVSFDEVREYIVKRGGVIEGAVISGGEPSIHNGLKGLRGELKALGLKVKIDTNGLEPDVITGCNPDYAALDVKTSPEKYHLLNIPPKYNDIRERLRLSIDIVRKMGDSAEVRITAVPGIIDRDDIDCLAQELRGVKKIFIQQFETAPLMLDPSYKSVKPYPTTELEVWREIFIKAGIDCVVRGH
jgi:pyruvate formate lyase activating enzyme